MAEAIPDEEQIIFPYVSQKMASHMNVIIKRGGKKYVCNNLFNIPM